MIKVFAYPTDSQGRVSLRDAQKITGTEDGWSEYTPEPDMPEIHLVGLALKWASEGQAVRIEIN